MQEPTIFFQSFQKKTYIWCVILKFSSDRVNFTELVIQIGHKHVMLFVSQRNGLFTLTDALLVELIPCYL